MTIKPPTPIEALRAELDETLRVLDWAIRTGANQLGLIAEWNPVARLAKRDAAAWREAYERASTGLSHIATPPGDSRLEGENTQAFAARIAASARNLAPPPVKTP